MFQYILQYLIVMKHQEIYYEGHVFSLQPKKLFRQSFVKLQNCDIQEITFVLAVYKNTLLKLHGSLKTFHSIFLSSFA